MGFIVNVGLLSVVSRHEELLQEGTSSSWGSDKCEGSMILPILSSVERELHHLHGGTFETQSEPSVRRP